MSASATPDFNSDGVADIFSAATGTLTVGNSEGALHDVPHLDQREPAARDLDRLARAPA